MEVTMPRLDKSTGGKYAQPVPDPDSLAMDDRGTRPYRYPGECYPRERRVPDDNYIGDPNKPGENIRAGDTASEGPLPASDAPTLIRDDE
jgi:hypothetical protein